jgi:ABC-type polysaccharide/polyol phosphate transport system ATPase subunit
VARAIEIRGLSKCYAVGGRPETASLREAVTAVWRRQRPAPRLLWALRELDLDVEDGDTLGIVGRNGSGKSTLLKILSRITEPTAGSARVRGRMGSLLEVGTGFHPELSGRENVVLNGVILGMRRRDIAARLDEIVAFAGVERFLDTPLKHYSSGMYLRLAFAVAAHVEPDILVVDEVLAVGDAEFQRACLGRMSALRSEGRTVLFVSHDLGAIAQLCQRCAWLDGGRLADLGRTDAVLERYLRTTVSTARQATIALRAGVLELQEAAVLAPDGDPAAPVRRDAPLVLRVRYRLAERVPGLDLAFGLRTLRGDEVLDEALSDAPDGDRASAGAPGEHEATLTIDPVLASGDYVLWVWIGVGEEQLVHADLLTFTLEPALTDRDEQASRLRIVQPPVRWSVRHQPLVPPLV